MAVSVERSFTESTSLDDMALEATGGKLFYCNRSVLAAFSPVVAGLAETVLASAPGSHPTVPAGAEPEAVEPTADRRAVHADAMRPLQLQAQLVQRQIAPLGQPPANPAFIAAVVISSICFGDSG